jgi:hypothetical protein
MDYERTEAESENLATRVSGKRASHSAMPIYLAAAFGIVVTILVVLAILNSVQRHKATNRRAHLNVHDEALTGLAATPYVPSSKPHGIAKPATPGEVLAAGLIEVMSREDACLGATILHNDASNETVGIGSEFRLGAGAEIDKYLAKSFRPIGVFVVTRLDETSLRTLVVTHKSIAEADEPFIKELIRKCANTVFPGLTDHRIAKA